MFPALLDQMKYTIEKHSKVSLLDAFTKFWMKEKIDKFAEKSQIRYTQQLYMIRV